MDENRTNTSLQEAYERLFERLLVVEKQLGHKIDALENVHNKLIMVNRQIREMLSTSAEQVCIFVYDTGASNCLRLGYSILRYVYILGPMACLPCTLQLPLLQ